MPPILSRLLLAMSLVAAPLLASTADAQCGVRLLRPATWFARARAARYQQHLNATAQVQAARAAAQASTAGQTYVFPGFVRVTTRTEPAGSQSGNCITLEDGTRVCEPMAAPMQAAARQPCEDCGCAERIAELERRVAALEAASLVRPPRAQASVKAPIQLRPSRTKAPLHRRSEVHAPVMVAANF